MTDEPKKTDDKPGDVVAVGSKEFVRRLPRWKKYGLLLVLIPLTLVLAMPGTIIEVAQEWQDWAKKIAKWWHTL